MKVFDVFISSFKPLISVAVVTIEFTLQRSYFTHTVYLCVLRGSENKQRLFHCTALTDWFL
jgi:hypothetical protein